MRWSSDLRGFTERSDRLPSERIIAILNALFEAQAVEIRGHGGEILKFIGDGLLAIFPIAETDAVAAIAKAAVAAARSRIAGRCAPQNSTTGWASAAAIPQPSSGMAIQRRSKVP